MVKYYVRLNSDPLQSPYYIFSLTSGGESVGVPTLQRGKYYVFERTDSGHPFNIGTGWKENNGSISFTSTSTSNLVDGIGSIENGEKISFYIPIDYANDIKYYSYFEENMINSFDLTNQQICFRGDTQVKTSDGYKNIENLKRGDIIITNTGAHPLAKLTKGHPISMIKIPKDLLAKNVPNRDVVVCPWHPLSVKILTGDDDDEPEFLHMLAGELEIFDEVKG